MPNNSGNISLDDAIALSYTFSEMGTNAEPVGLVGENEEVEEVAEPQQNGNNNTESRQDCINHVIQQTSVFSQINHLEYNEEEDLSGMSERARRIREIINSGQLENLSHPIVSIVEALLGEPLNVSLYTSNSPSIYYTPVLYAAVRFIRINSLSNRQRTYYPHNHIGIIYRAIAMQGGRSARMIDSRGNGGVDVSLRAGEVICATNEEIANTINRLPTQVYSRYFPSFVVEG